MKTDLLELLNQTYIVHPTRIIGIEASNRQLRMTVSGYQWWRKDAVAEEGQIVFTFQGIGEGQLDLATLLDTTEVEALEHFEVSLLSEKEWAKSGLSFATYCSGPMQHPLRLYAIVEDYLWKAGALCSARDYLNMPNGSLLSFCEIAGTSSYLLAEAPLKVHELVLAELKRQNVYHNVVPSNRASTRTLLIQIGPTQFLCEGATAEA
jgi:hypothetical protein